MDFQMTSAPAPAPASTFPTFSNYSFDLSKPLSYGFTVDESNFSSKLKHPVHVEQMKLSSDSALKSYNGIYHNFFLPLVGDYAFNFCLRSDYILKRYKDSTINVDCVQNYMDSISLNVNANNAIISRIDGLSKIETITPQSLNDKHQIKLDFVNLPILIKYMEDSSYQIAIKFAQAPPVRYEITYDLMFSDDKNYRDTLKKDEFTIIYNARQSQNNRKKVGLNFKNGRISFK
jgi:hypothetical protein